MRKSSVIIFRTIIFFIVLLAVVMLFAPTVAHRIVEKNSKAWIGRQIRMGDLDLNYASFTLSVSDFVLYETNDADTFFTFKTFRINLQPWRLIKKEYAFKEFLLDSFYIYAAYDGKAFNFDDLLTEEVDSFAAETIDKGYHEEIHFSLENIDISNGRFELHDKRENVRFNLNDLNLQLPLLSWDNKQAEMGVDLDFGKGGTMHFAGEIDRGAQTYRLEMQLDSMQLHPFSGYIQPYLNSSGIEGSLYNTVVVKGSLSKFNNIIITGHAAVGDFKLKDTNDEPVLQADRSVLRLDSIDIMNKFIHISEISVSNPTIIAEKYDTLSNLEILFGPMLEEVELPPMDSFAAVADELVPVQYFIDSIVVHNGTAEVSDLSLNRPFRYRLTSMEAKLKDVAYYAEKIPVTFGMVLNNEGTVEGESGISLNDPHDFNLKVQLEKLDLASFSPYSETYIARPVTHGRMDYRGEVNMSREEFRAENDIFISELELGPKTDDEPQIKAPVKLGLYILKDKDDNIEMNVPMWGDPMDPEFDMGKIVLHTLSDFLVKVASEPFDLLGNVVGTNPDRIKKMELELTRDSLSPDNIETLEKLAEVLQRKKDLVFMLTQETPMEVEKRVLAVQAVCSAYLNGAKNKQELQNTTAVAGWETVNQSDTSFVNFLNELSGLPDSVSFESRCVAAIGEEALGKRFNRLLETRNEKVRNYLSEQLMIDSTLFEVRTADLVNLSVQSDKPMYRIEVSVK